MDTDMRILERVEAQMGAIDRLSLLMDLEYSNVDLGALASADDETFFHDISGIVRHMDRENCRLGSGFVPRAGFKA